MNRTMWTITASILLGSASIAWAGCAMCDNSCPMDDDKGKAPATQPAATTKPSADANYVCPMHDGGQSDKPSKCPKCGMDMVEKKS